MELHRRSAVTTQKENTISEAILLSGAILAVALRFWARRIMKAKYWWDDWCALLSLCIFTAGNIELFEARYRHREIDVIDPAQFGIKLLIDSLKVVFVQTYLMAFTITFARFSVIFFYHRIFGVYDGFRRGLWIIGVLSVSWLLTSFFLNTFRCHPITASWDPLTMKDACIDLNTLFVPMESLNCALDLALVLLPIKWIGKLQLSLRDRIGLAAVFITGAFVCITSILRIRNAYQNDPIESIFWLTLQLAFAVICCCLPTLRTFLPKRVPTPQSISMFLSSRTRERSSQESKGKNKSDSDSALV